MHFLNKYYKSHTMYEGLQIESEYNEAEPPVQFIIKPICFTYGKSYIYIYVEVEKLLI